MGRDICCTNHAEADWDDMDALLTLLGVAGRNYFILVPGADDIMLHHQSRSFHGACIYVLARPEASARRAQHQH